MCQDDTWEIVSQSDYPFRSYDQKFKCSLYVYHWVRHNRLHLSSCGHGILLRNTLRLGVVTQSVQVRTVRVKQISGKRSIGHVGTSESPW